MGLATMWAVGKVGEWTTLIPVAPTHLHVPGHYLAGLCWLLAQTVLNRRLQPDLISVVVGSTWALSLLTPLSCVLEV